MFEMKTLAVTLALSLLPGLSSAEDVMQGRQCGTRELSATEIANREGEFRFRYESARSMLRITWSVAQPITIPVWFHVIYKTDGAGQDVGNVPKSRIVKQIVVLNQAYKGSGFKFRLAGITRTLNKKWFDGCMDKPNLENSYKAILAKDPATNLNMYSCDSAQGTLGYAYFPSDGPEGDYHHGVVLKYDSLPGNKPPFGAGVTAVHETGHYLGLYHTFEGCAGGGDQVSDTPAERSPAYGCQLNRDSCGGLVGKDPVMNFMDYSDDSCMTNFSIGQIERMQKQVAAYRPSLLD